MGTDRWKLPGLLPGKLCNYKDFDVGAADIISYLCQALFTPWEDWYFLRYVLIANRFVSSYELRAQVDILAGWHIVLEWLVHHRRRETLYNAMDHFYRLPLYIAYVSQEITYTGVSTPGLVTSGVEIQFFSSLSLFPLQYCCQVIKWWLLAITLEKMAAISQTIFQMHFHEWNILYFDLNCNEFCSYIFDWQ